MDEDIKLSPIIVIIGVLVGLLTLTLVKWFLRGTMCTNRKRLDGKTVLITGATSGIGLELAKDLCRRGAKVLMTYRNESKGIFVKNFIEKELLAENNADPLGSLVLKKLNLASLDSIREFSEQILRDEERLDILVLNAGIMMTPLYPRTEEGFEMQMASNHLGHFLLVQLLMPLLTASPPPKDVRIVIVSSQAHKLAKTRMRCHDLNWHRENQFSPSQGYFQSKLANILLGKELAKRLDGSGISVVSLHPGVVNTSLTRNAGNSADPIANLFYFNHKIFSSMIKSPVEGIQTLLFCCLDDSIHEKSGSYFEECREVIPSNFAQSQEDSAKLWEISEQLTK